MTSVFDAARAKIRGNAVQAVLTSRVFWILAGIVVVGAVLRLWGITHGLPYNITHSDETTTVGNAISMGSNRTLVPVSFYYPTFYSYLLLALYLAYFGIGYVLGIFQSVADFGMLYVTSPGNFLLIGRVLTAAFGTLTLVLVYFWGARLYNRLTGIVAAGLLAGAALPVAHAHFALADIPMSFFVTVTLFFLGCFLDTGLQRYSHLAAIAAGVGTSLKYNAGLVALPMLLVHILVWRSTGRAKPLTLVKSVATAYALTGIAFLAGTPYWLLEFRSYFSTFVWQSANQRIGNITNVSTPWIWIPEGIVSTELLLGITMLLGIIYAAFRSTRQDWILVFFVVFYGVYVGSWAKAGMNYLLPVWPALALLAARFLVDTTARLGRRQAVFAAGISLMLVLPQAIQSAVNDYRMSNPDTRVMAKAWIESNIEPGARIATTAQTVPLVAYGGEINSTGVTTYSDPAFRTKFEAYLASSKKYLLYQLETRADPPGNIVDPYLRDVYSRQFRSVEDLRMQQIGYVVLSSYEYNQYLEGDPPPQDHPLRQAFDLGKDYYTSLQRSPALHLMQGFRASEHNLGPTILVYKVTP